MRIKWTQSAFHKTAVEEEGLGRFVTEIHKYWDVP